MGRSTQALVWCASFVFRCTEKSEDILTRAPHSPRYKTRTRPSFCLLELYICFFGMALLVALLRIYITDDYGHLSAIDGHGLPRKIFSMSGWNRDSRGLRRIFAGVVPYRQSCSFGIFTAGVGTARHMRIDAQFRPRYSGQDPSYAPLP